VPAVGTACKSGIQANRTGSTCPNRWGPMIAAQFAPCATFEGRLPPERRLPKPRRSFFLQAPRNGQQWRSVLGIRFRCHRPAPFPSRAKNRDRAAVARAPWAGPEDQDQQDEAVGDSSGTRARFRRALGDRDEKPRFRRPTPRNGARTHRPITMIRIGGRIVQFWNVSGLTVVR